MVAKDELLEELWPGSVSESVLPRCITAARRALEDDSTKQAIIQTIRRRGYRFVATVTSQGPASLAAPRGAAVGIAAPGSSAPGVPSAILPTPSAPIPPPPQPAFVGRSQALGQLHAAIDAALSRRGQVVLLAGEPGIGKTRTATEVAATAATRGATVLAGRCFEGEGAPAFWPWVQVLRKAFDEGALDPRSLGLRAADLAPLVPEIRDAVPDLPEPPAVTPEQARFRQFDSIASVLGSVSTDRPLVILLDDLHWADTPSLLLLSFLARGMADTRILIIGTYRDTALPRSAPLSQALGGLTREPVVRRVVLEGLSEKDVARLIASASGATPSPGWVTRVHRMTEGNPFFIEEIVRVLVTEGHLKHDPDDARIGLPQGVREAVGRRLSGLSDACHQVLTVASVVGRELSTPVLSLALGRPLDRLLDVLHEAVTAGVLAEVPGTTGRYTFAHDMIRETLYEDLPTPDRVRMHLRVGEAMEAVHGGHPGPYLAELSHHFYQGAPAGDPGKAVDYAVAAARRAWASLAYEDAARHYQRALDASALVTPADEARRARLLLRLGEAHVRSGNQSDGRAAYRSAAELARALSDSRLLARAALGMAQRADFGMPLDAELVEHLREAERAIGDTDDRLKAGLLARMAMCAPYSESITDRRMLSKRGLDLARRIDDPQWLAGALASRFWALAGPDDHEERLALCEEIDRLAEETEDRNLAFMACEMRTIVLTGLGDVGGATRAVESLQRLADELGEGLIQWYVAGLHAGQALNEGRFSDAEELIGRYVEQGRDMHPGALLLAAAQRLWLHRGRDELEQYALAGKLFRKRFSWGVRVSDTMRCFVALELGRRDEARTLFERIADQGLAQFPRDEHWMVCMVQLAMVAARLPDVARCQELYDLLLPYAERPAFHERTRVHSGVVARFLGLLCAALGRREDATGHFEQAVRLNAKLGARPYQARSLADFAAFLLEGEGSDGPNPEAVARATQLSAEALATAEDLGMPLLARHARDLLEQADAQV